MTKVLRATISLGMTLVLALAPIESFAHVAEFDSRVSINHEGNTFFGKVHSVRRECEPNRIVRVWKVREDRPDRFVGQDETNVDGEWRVSRRGLKGSFYAVVTAKIVGGYGHSHKCNKDRSRTIKAP